jgi:hypothetical protein
MLLDDVMVRVHVGDVGDVAGGHSVSDSKRKMGEWENVVRDDKDGKRRRDFTQRHRLHNQEGPGVQSGAMTMYG